MVYLNQEDFGTFKNEIVKKFTWRTDRGFSVSVISYGAIIQSIRVPDKDGISRDVVLGFDNLDGYVTRNSPYLGATVGRCANRIGGAEFQIDSKTYIVAKNIGNDHLHGGIVGFDKVNWTSSVDGTKVTFSYLSKDGEEGYPGNLITNVIYEVTDDDALHLTFKSITDKKTLLNLTNHSYFNLAGHDAGADGLFDHVISINADKITETSSESIPTGRFTKVGGTPFDLRIPIRLGDAMSKADDLFDDNFCVTTFGRKDLTFVSRVYHPDTGRYLELYSNQPGVQLYTGNSLPDPSDSALIGKDGVGYRRHGAFCLETQNYPDAIHHNNFPDGVLKPGDVYEHKVVYRFGVERNNGPRVVSV
ncbi:galactose mutarotase-like [Colias croceus]|uniref:galactose mutarotase-like n=1 Tax=Colias crocea TaxID=72248 RepID=UPI001E27EC50|nr:galactose mutarotase-like [Colias croceus]